jgi:hypothetical protein
MGTYRTLGILLFSLSFAGCPKDDSAEPATQSGGAGGSAKVSADFCTSKKALPLDACSGDPSTFSLTIDNPFFPLVVGQTSVFEGEEDGAMVHLEVEVMDQTETIGGVTTRVIEEREKHDGEIVEISRNYFAQAKDGTVCYFGEEVDLYEGGKITGHEGAWRAEGKSHAGIMMPPVAKDGDFYAQEDAPDVAEDRAEVTSLGKKQSVPAGDFTDTIDTRECTPLEPDSGYENKVYARGVGLIVDGTLQLVSK